MYPLTGRKITVKHELLREFRKRRAEHRRAHAVERVSKYVPTIHLADFVDEVIRRGLASLNPSSDDPKQV